MANKNTILADIEKINTVEVRRINGVDMYEISKLEKAFNRPVEKFWEQPYIREYIKALAYVKHQQICGGEITASYMADRIKIVKNMYFGCGDGVWMCEELFIEYARWLSPYFAVKCNLHSVPLLHKI